eukprot:5668035-Amphidinium_carterae.1
MQRAGSKNICACHGVTRVIGTMADAALQSLGNSILSRARSWNNHIVQPSSMHVPSRDGARRSCIGRSAQLQSSFSLNHVLEHMIGYVELALNLPCVQKNDHNRREFILAML